MSKELERRCFLKSAGLAVGAVVASSVVPMGFANPLSPVAVAGPQIAEGTGHIDDACGHSPPYSHPIPYGYAVAGPGWEHWDPIDFNFRCG